MKMAAHYKNRPSEIDRSLLTVIPDAPRIAQPVVPNSYDWSILDENRSNSNSINVIIFWYEKKWLDGVVVAVYNYLWIIVFRFIF